MSESDAQKISERLTTLEVSMREKWESHDKRAAERWADLMEKFHEMSKSLSDRPCKEHIKMMLELNHRVSVVEKWLNAAGWAIGVVYIAVIGAVVSRFL